MISVKTDKVTDQIMSLDARIEALEKRILLLEDRAQIFQLIASYGPAVDSLDGEALAQLWTDDARYDTDGYIFDGNAAIADLVNLPQHQAFVAEGSAHVMSVPAIQITGDTATATNYSRVYLVDGEQHKVIRTSANKWWFKRQENGWKICDRTNRRLTGDDAARLPLKFQL